MFTLKWQSSDDHAQPFDIAKSQEFISCVGRYALWIECQEMLKTFAVPQFCNGMR